MHLKVKFFDKGLIDLQTSPPVEICYLGFLPVFHYFLAFLQYYVLATNRENVNGHYQIRLGIS